MILTAASVASFLHATIAAYVARALLDGATTRARRLLGRSFALFTAYSIAIGAGYTLSTEHPPLADVAFATCVAFAIGSSLEMMELARAVVFAERGAKGARVLRAVLAALTGATLAGYVGFYATGHDPSALYGVLALLSFATIVAALVVFAIGARRVPLARALGVAAAFPLIPAALDLLNVAGLPIPLYRYVRDLSLLLYCFLALTAYMDHGAEPISLRRRFLAGLLTSVLGVVACSTEWSISRLHAATPAETMQLVHRTALGFVAVGALATVVTLVVFPRMVRRSVLEPLDRLATAARSIEGGKPARVDVVHHDEIGETSGAFNQMVDALASNRRSLEEQLVALEKSHTEIASLNAELRRQVAARSRQLQDAIRELEGPRSLVRAGELVGGRYRVVRELGGGGMGIVFEVDDEIEHRRLALKVIASSTSKDDMVRFAREAEIAASVHHENVVPVVDVGVHQGAPYLVMELVSGGSLEGLRNRFGDPAWGLPIVGQIAAALSVLHARGVVHRDLKPANVLLEERAGRVIARVTDFGIARHDVDAFAATQAHGAASVTATGVVIGTLPYMAPEVGRGVREASAKVDVFALGIIAFELLTARYPFAAPPVLDAMAGREPGPLPALPDAIAPTVRATLGACLAATPDARPTATEIVRVFGIAENTERA
jgi:HAMP domain-containing protein